LFLTSQAPVAVAQVEKFETLLGSQDLGVPYLSYLSYIYPIYPIYLQHFASILHPVPPRSDQIIDLIAQSNRPNHGIPLLMQLVFEKAWRPGKLAAWKNDLL